jgi:hypothetical protein
MTLPGQVEDFDAGKAIFDLLKDLPPERQGRVLRWVAEGLGISLAPTSSQLGLTHHTLVVPPLPAPPPPALLPPQDGPGANIKSFVTTKSPKSDQQFAAAVAYFYRFEAPPDQRRDSIDSDALQEAARLVGRKRLGKPLATLNNAKAAGYLDSGSRGEFSINSVGENLVAMALPAGGAAAAGQARNPKAKKKGPKGGRSTKRA